MTPTDLNALDSLPTAYYRGREDRRKRKVCERERVIKQFLEDEGSESAAAQKGRNRNE